MRVIYWLFGDQVHGGVCMWHKLRQEVLIELLSIEERRAEKLPDTHSHRHTLTYRQNTSGLILFSVISQENIHKSQSLNPNTDMLFVCVCACLRVHAALSVHACVCVCALNCISLPEIEALTKPFSCSLLLIPQKDRFCILAWVYNAIYSC